MSRLFPLHPEAKKHRIAMLRRRLSLLLILSFLGLLLLVYIGIRFSGTWLIKGRTVNHIPWVAVLDGQSAGMERTDFAVKLLTTGQADSVVVLGKRVFRDRFNSDFYIEDMQRQGSIDLTKLFLIRHDDNSSMDEAYSLIPALKVRGVDSVLLLTSEAATRRVDKIFNRLAGGSPVFITMGIKDPLYNPRTWIHNRESRKIWIKEWASYLVSFYELAFVKPIVPIKDKPYPLDVAASALKQEEVLTPIAAELSSSSAISSSSSEESSASSSSKAEKVSEKKPEKSEKTVDKKEKSKSSGATAEKKTTSKKDSKKESK